MARAKRWTIPFKSLDGINCRVDIYAQDWTGSVTTLTGGADPFYYEDTNSDDLLNNVIRFKTGYINLIETSSGELDDIYPEDTFDRYVEFYYNNSLRFTGYIQQQSFTQDWSAPPHEVQFPVISPLGLHEKMVFTTVYPPVNKTLGSLLDEVITNLNAAYSYVYLPVITDIDLSLEINSLIISPWDEEYHHSINSGLTNYFMKGENYTYILEGICKAFGWIVHDMHDALLFTMFDHTGNYCRYPVGHVGNNSYKETISIPTGAIDFYFTPAGSDSKYSTILPVKSIAVSYEGDLLDNEEVTLDRTAFYNVAGYGSTERTCLANLTPITNEIQNVSPATFTGNLVDYGSHSVALNGDEEGILVSLDPSYQSGRLMFTVRHYMKTSGFSFAVEYETQTGDYIASLESDNDIKDNIKTILTTTATYVEVDFHLFWNATYPFPVKKLIFFKNIRIIMNKNSLPYVSYQEKPASTSDIIPSTLLTDKTDVNVTMPISLYRESTNLIGDTVWSTKLTEYPYMFSLRHKLSGTFKGALPSLPYALLFSYWKPGWNWRIISVDFYPWDDNYKLTLLHSSTI